MEYDPIRYLDLLEDYTSRETARARRNVALLSFAVILVHILDVSLADLQIAGVPIVGDRELLVTSIAFSLETYWALLFAVRFATDNGRRRERQTILDEMVTSAGQRSKTLEELSAKERGFGPERTRELRSLKNFLARYEAQHGRTGFTRKWLSVGQWLDWLPTAIVALGACIVFAIRLIPLIGQLLPEIWF